LLSVNEELNFYIDIFYFILGGRIQILDIRLRCFDFKRTLQSFVRTVICIAATCARIHDVITVGLLGHQDFHSLQHRKFYRAVYLSCWASLHMLILSHDPSIHDEITVYLPGHQDNQNLQHQRSTSLELDFALYTNVFL
jgi:hypothetical protein